MYTFQSRATGKLLMLEPNGRQILEVIGKAFPAAAVKGILLPEHMPAAIAALQAAVAREEALLQQQGQEAKTKGQVPPRAQGISLRQRATPFIAMLRRCQLADTEMVWGV